VIRLASAHKTSATARPRRRLMHRDFRNSLSDE